MSNFICNGCREQILPQKARFHCQTCPDYDFCANCYVVGQVSGNHSSLHPTALLKNSGLRNRSSKSEANATLAPGKGQSSSTSQGANLANPQQQPSSSGQSSSNQSQPTGRQAPVTGHNTAPPAWGPLYNPDSTPTPLFVSVIEQIFSRLDLSRTGYLTPEAYSAFQDAQGCAPNLNICISFPTSSLHS